MGQQFSIFPPAAPAPAGTSDIGEVLCHEPRELTEPDETVLGAALQPCAGGAWLFLWFGYTPKPRVRRVYLAREDCGALGRALLALEGAAAEAGTP